jgi:WD40 repeat protein
MFAAAHETPLRVDQPMNYKIGVWDVATLEQRAELDLGGRSPTELAFTPDGTRLVALTSSDAIIDEDPDGEISATMISWRAPDFDGEKRVPLDKNTLTALEFTPDGRTLLTAGTEGVVQIRDPVTGELRGTFGRHTSTVREIAVSPDGHRVATVTVEDPVVRLWDLDRQELLATLTGHGGALNEIVFSPDGTMLASGGTDTDVGVWRLDPETVVRQLCDNLADAGEKDLDDIGC